MTALFSFSILISNGILGMISKIVGRLITGLKP